MQFSGGYVQLRRGILDHTYNGSLSFNDFGVHSAILLLADKAKGSWCGSAPALHTIIHIPERTAQHCLERLEDADGQYILRDFTPGKQGNYPILINKYLLTVGTFKGWRVNIQATKRYYGIPSGDLDVLMRKSLKDAISKACKHPVLEPCTDEAEELVAKLRERGVVAASVLLGGGVVTIPLYPNTSDTSDTSIPESKKQTTTVVPPPAGSCPPPSSTVTLDRETQVIPKEQSSSDVLDEKEVVPPPATEEFSDPRQWCRDAFGISAERIRDCVAFHLDERKNPWYLANLNSGSLTREKFVKKLNADTPKGWKPGSGNSKNADLTTEFESWVTEMEEKANAN